MREASISEADRKAFDLLVACSDWPPSAQGNRATASAAKLINGDWPRFIALAQRHHLSIIAAQNLRTTGVEPPARLVELAKQHKRRALTLAGEALRIIEVLRKADCEAAMIKGPLLSQQLFGDLAMRQSVDIDLLVDWSDFRHAVNVLRENGYVLRGHEPPWDDWRIDTWRTLAKDVTLIKPEGHICIELHHRLKTPDSLLPGLGLAQATNTASFSGREMKAFAHRDLFVYLCVHAATSFWDRLKWLADLRALIAEMDIAELEQWQKHSEHLGTERCTALGLILCHRLWGQTIPEAVKDLSQSAPWLSDLEAASINRLHAPERNRSSIANSLDRRLLRELRADKTYRSAQWRELVYDDELLEQVWLPRTLRAFYFPLRVGLFALRKLGLRGDQRMIETR